MYGSEDGRVEPLGAAAETNLVLSILGVEEEEGGSMCIG